MAEKFDPYAEALRKLEELEKSITLKVLTSEGEAAGKIEYVTHLFGEGDGVEYDLARWAVQFAARVQGTELNDSAADDLLDKADAN